MSPEMQFLYRHWAKAGLVAAFFILILLLFNSKTQPGSFQWLFWLLLPLYMIHQFEEHVWPGGFKNRMNQLLLCGRIPDFPVSEVNIFFINIIYIWLLLPLFIIGGAISVILPAVMTAFIVINGLTHIGALIRQKCYNPGLAASLFLNVPVGTIIFWQLLSAGLLSLGQLAVVFILGTVLHVPIFGYFLLRTKRYLRAGQPENTRSH